MGMPEVEGSRAYDRSEDSGFAGAARLSVACARRCDAPTRSPAHRLWGALDPKRLREAEAIFDLSRVSLRIPGNRDPVRTGDEYGSLRHYHGG